MQWYYQVDGDTQAVRYYNGNVYFGFHEGAIGDHTVRMLVADATTGVLENSYRPPIDSFFGIWAIDASPDGSSCSAASSPTSTASATQGVAIMPPQTADTVAARPHAGTPTVTATTRARRSSLAWTPAPTTRPSPATECSATACRSRTRRRRRSPTSTSPADTDTIYSVQTIDAAGNLSTASGTVTAHTGLLPIVAGSTWKYLDNGSNQGTAWRAPAFDDSTWASGAGRARLRRR